ncbi:MAG: hypothetical protein P8Z30_06880 [Acidobacteriota bacterium]
MKALFSLFLLGVVAFCATRIVPPYVENYELQGYVNRVAVQATAHSKLKKPEAIQNQILTKAESLGLPLERQNISVSVKRKVRIKLDYSVYVDLRFYMLTLHFTPSAQNSDNI